MAIDLDILPMLPAVSGPHCGGCPNAYDGVRLIPPDGKGYSGVMIVGDSGWEWEAREGKPFAGPAGQFLDRHIFRRLGVPREAFTLTNTTWCKAPRLNFYDKAGPDATEIIEHCRPYLDELIEKIQPRVIIPMGNVALRRICGVSGINAHQCYIHDTPYGIPAISTFHPSFVMQDNLKYTPVVLFAFRKALEIAKQGTFARQPVDYCLDPSLPDLEQWMARHGHSFELDHAVDIENPWGKLEDQEKQDDPHKGSGWDIIRCGFSFREGTAASFPWVEPFISFTRDLLKQAQTVIYHNASHDRPRLREQDCPTLGRVYDTMWMFHFLQSDLPKGLKFISPFYTDMPEWASQKDAQPAWYNACDNDATLRNFNAMKAWLIKQGRWERFTRHCSDAAEILGEMSSAGVLIDVEARSALQDGLRSEIATLDLQIQSAIPRELLPVKELKTERTLKELSDNERADWETIEGNCDCEVGFVDGGAYSVSPKPKCRRCKGTGRATIYRKQLPFNWNSTDQCQDLARHYNFKIPNKRGEDREALESKTLRQFGKRKAVFLDIWNARKRYKLISTYNWVLDVHGRVHTKFGFHPSTWRKSARDPNLQTIPKRNELAAAFKRTIIAASGHVLIEADSSAIEAVLVGYSAQSPRYIRAAKAGIHDIFMSHVRAYREGGRGIDIALADKDLIDACRAAKKEDASRPLNEQIRDACKRCIHGTNYGLSPFGMHDEYPDEFPTQKVATELQEMYLNLFPEIKSWMRKTREMADRQTFLDNHYQYRHYFFAVTKWNTSLCVKCNKTRSNPARGNRCPKCGGELGGYELSTDGKRCIAFLPQSDASAIQTEDLLTLAADPITRSMLRLIIHDSYVLECPIDMIDYTCDKLYTTMTRPRPELGGLTIGTEIKYGINLQDTQVWTPKLSGN